MSVSSSRSIFKTKMTRKGRRVVAATAAAALVAAPLLSTAAGAAPLGSRTIYTVGATGDPEADNRRDWVLDVYGQEPIPVPYPASMVGMQASIDAGVENLQAALGENQSDYIIVVAMSQGAVVAEQVAHQRDIAENANERYILMGSPDFRHGISDRLPISSIPVVGLPLAGSQGTEHVRVSQICLAGDVMCDPSGSPINYPLSFVAIHMGMLGGNTYNDAFERDIAWRQEDGSTEYTVYENQPALSYIYTALSGKQPSEQGVAFLEIIAPTSRTVGVGGPVTFFDPRAVENFVNTLRPAQVDVESLAEVLPSSETELVNVAIDSEELPASQGSTVDTDVSATADAENEAVSASEETSTVEPTTSVEESASVDTSQETSPVVEQTSAPVEPTTPVVSESAPQPAAQVVEPVISEPVADVSVSEPV